MILFKEYNNGLRLIVKKIDGLLSVSAGIFVMCGSANETSSENGISHFIEHTMFKGTKTRSAFDISDQIDRIGAQINAYTSKEMTCYYTKSTTEHFLESIDILSDIFFNSKFDDEDLNKEREVILQEIAMTDDDPEDICLDTLAKSYYGNGGFGAPILGSTDNVKRFNHNDVINYMKKYYTPKNVVISIAGNVDLTTVEDVIKKYFADKFVLFGERNNVLVENTPKRGNYAIYKDIEQAHLALAMPSCDYCSPRINAANIIATVFGGGMSSRLFQTVREKMGLAYSVYSFLASYKQAGTLCVYAGVNADKRDEAYKAIINEIEKIHDNGITKSEFESGREQVKSSFIMSQESTATQMQVYGRQLLKNEIVFDFEKKIAEINKLTLDDVNNEIKQNFNLADLSKVTVGRNKTKLGI